MLLIYVQHQPVFDCEHIKITSKLTVNGKGILYLSYAEQLACVTRKTYINIL